MSRVAKLCVLLERLPPRLIDAGKLASSYHLPLTYVERLVGEALQRRGIAA